MLFRSLLRAPGEANLQPAQGKRFARENPRRKHGGGGHVGANRAIQAVPEFLLTGSQYKPTLIAVEESLGGPEEWAEAYPQEDSADCFADCFVDYSAEYFAARS